MEKSIDKSKQYILNPRIITDPELERLQDHLYKFGDLGGVVYCRNNKAYVGGNQRSKIFDGATIEILKTFDVPQEDKTVALGFILWNDRKYLYREVEFTEHEFKEACIAANSDGGTWDVDILKESWNTDDLEEWGFDVDLLFEEFDEKVNQNTESAYTKKIESPVYEPKNEKPPISELYDYGRTKDLIANIKKSSVSPEIKEFLIKAAERHTVFNYEKIADFYAHSDKEVRELMEDSALVIIDFDKAIDLGYVLLSDELKNQYLVDYGAEED